MKKNTLKNTESCTYPLSYMDLWERDREELASAERVGDGGINFTCHYNAGAGAVSTHGHNHIPRGGGGEGGRHLSSTISHHDILKHRLTPSPYLDVHFWSSNNALLPLLCTPSTPILLIRLCP